MVFRKTQSHQETDQRQEMQAMVEMELFHFHQEATKVEAVRRGQLMISSMRRI